MKSTSTIGVLVHITACGAALAQPGSGLFSSGFLHSPTGGVSSLVDAGRAVTACCIPPQ